jgi:hypothetical protein
MDSVVPIASITSTLIGLSAAVAAHNVSRNGALLGYFPLPERTKVEDVLIFMAMWVALLAGVAWLWLTQPWWLALGLMLFPMIGSNLLLLALPRTGDRPMPFGRPAFWTVSVIAIAAIGAAYLLEFGIIYG